MLGCAQTGQSPFTPFSLTDASLILNKTFCRVEKSYNSSRKEWYYGIKLHAIVARNPGCLPIPVSLIASGAAQHDLPAAKQIVEDHASLKPGRLYADKAYIDADWTQSLKQNHALVSGDTFSTFVSSVRQPIECFFN